MDVRHLRNMLAVIEEGTIAKAAQRVNMSQPAMTKSIQRLEEQLGVRLFERVPRGMRPTYYAHALQDYARAACVGMAEAERQISALRGGTEGSIVIAAPAIIMTNLIPAVLAKLSKERPKLQMRLVSQNASLYSDLLDGKFSVVVSMLFDEIPKRGLVKEWLFDDRLVLVMRPDHPLAKQRQVKARDLLPQKWVFGHGDNFGLNRLKTYFEQDGFDLPKPSIESHDHVVMKSVLMATDHVGLIARLGVEKEVASGLLKCLEIDSPLMARPIGVIRREREPTSPATDAFIRLLKELSKSRRAGKKRSASTSA